MAAVWRMNGFHTLFATDPLLSLFWPRSFDMTSRGGAFLHSSPWDGDCINPVYILDAGYGYVFGFWILLATWVIGGHSIDASRKVQMTENTRTAARAHNFAGSGGVTFGCALLRYLHKLFDR